MASSLELLALAKLSFWDNKPTATLTQSSATSIPNTPTPYQVVNFNAFQNDNWSGHSNVTNPSRYTVPVAGTYRISGMVTFAGNATGIRAAEFFQNGVLVPGSNPFEQPPGANFITIQLPAYNVVCAVNDYLEIGVYQSSGGSLNTVAGSTFFSIEFLHF